MKKALLPFILLTVLLPPAVFSQYAVHFVYKNTYSAAQVDSILTAQVGTIASAAFSPIYTVKTYQLVYNTFDADSIPTTATGLLVVPQGTPCEIPILSFQHNDILKKTDAPSNYGFASQWYVGLAAGSLGYIALMPDGIGLGNGPGFHVYLHLQSEATSVVDMIRAVKEGVDTLGASPNEQLFLAGVAEGGYATIAAHQFIQTYLDSTLHVTGSGAIAPFLDLSGTLVNSFLSGNSYPDPSYLPNLLFGYKKAYSCFTNDSDMLIYPYDSTLPPLFNGNNRNSTVDSHMPSVPNQILQPVQLDSMQNDSTYFLRQLLARNDAFNWAPTSPVYLLYCLADEYVPYQHSTVAYQHFVQNGSTMVDTFDIGQTYDHAQCGEFSTLVAISLIQSLVHKPIAAWTTFTNCTSAVSPNGTATVADSLGDPPYSWRWSTGDSTASISGLAAGTYYVTTTDRAHCTQTDSVTIALVDGVNDLLLSGVMVYPSPSHGLVHIDNINSNDPVNLIVVQDINGAEMKQQNAAGANSIIDLSEAPKGVYLLQVRSRSGKEMHRKIVLL